MAYCKWSDDNGYCDVYVAGDLKRGWTTRVAVKRHPAGRPMDSFSVIQELKNDPGKALRKAQEAHAACMSWEKDNPKIPISHKDAGAEFKHVNPLEWS
ncbi:hypothetical protein [Cognatiyoonia sp. IB215182]|uniref:hypothetical protein n=1 Tax=Cognatiyoonia sp. IB215182 TaxID=3097353 RepID=UPI002A17D12A|nr:hypothetical protein [Cognatiyoonia sp. IB215182]MDX8355677.1 hypothetical protein [Cognatiyoonia sp. IB215182]